MRHITALTLSTLLTLALFATPGYADSQLVGAWTGQLDAQTQREITVRHVDGRRVYGWYCISVPGLLRVNDFYGDDGSAAGTVKASTPSPRWLRTTIRDYRISAAVAPEGDHMDVTAKSRKGRKHFELHLTEAANAPCHPRIVPLPVAGVPDDDRPAGDTFADALEAVGAHPHPFVGAWTGQRQNGMVIELTVTSVDADGHVQGLYCNVWASGWRATDMHRDIPGAIDATATATELSFRHERNGRQFAFTLDGPNAMTYVQTIPERGTKTTTMIRTDDPACAPRVIVPTT